MSQLFNFILTFLTILLSVTFFLMEHWLQAILLFAIALIFLPSFDDGPAILLLHASGSSSWSWKYNIEGLSKKYQTNAIDLIGDVGKSEYTSLTHIMKNGQDQAALYNEVTDKLGIT